MPKYKVLLRGTGCWLSTGGGLSGLIRRRSPRRMGFYATRFVEAASPEEAGRKAVEMVTEEVRDLCRAAEPGSVTVEEVLEDGAGFEKHAPGAGFSWYPDDPGH